MKTQITSLQEQLLAARREGLEKAAAPLLRPLGKLWDMDVFAWHHPEIQELAKTIDTLPFPVLWLANQSTVKAMATEFPNVLKKIAWCGQFDSAKFPLPQAIAKSMPLVSATESLEDALLLLEGARQPKHALIFTVASGDWTYQLAKFEDFVRAESKR